LEAFSVTETFRRFSRFTSDVLGSAEAFAGAILLIILWALSGPYFHYSDTWQLAINTGTTIITFLMVFLIQNTQNRDSRALHLKLDELIKSGKEARNSLIDLDSLSDEQLHQLELEYKRVCAAESNDKTPGS
jgi:low affinity Fe/Cu permease